MWILEIAGGYFGGMAGGSYPIPLFEKTCDPQSDSLSLSFMLLNVGLYTSLGWLFCTPPLDFWWQKCYFSHISAKIEAIGLQKFGGSVPFFPGAPSLLKCLWILGVFWECWVFSAIVLLSDVSNFTRGNHRTNARGKFFDICDSGLSERLSRLRTRWVSVHGWELYYSGGWISLKSILNKIWLLLFNLNS